MTELVCPTCLSINRRQFPLDMCKYGSVFGDKNMMENVDSVCWECSSLFHKVYKFKQRVLQAQECLKSTEKEVSSFAPLSLLTCSIINCNDICCDQNIEKTNQDDKLQNRLEVINDDTIQNIKSEMFIDEDNNDGENICLKNYLITLSGIKSDTNEADIIETDRDSTSIKNENDSNEIFNDEITVDELFVNNTEKLSTLFKKKKTDLRRNQNVKIEEQDVIRVRNEEQRDNQMVTKDNYILIDMSEEEMLAARESDRQGDRYKNKVKYRCQSCIVGFFNKDIYEKHIRNKHSERAGAHRCLICDMRFKRASFHKEHIVSHYKKYKCRACEFVGYKLSEMVSHDAKEHDVKRCICKVCREEFPSPSSLRFHRETTHQAPSKCESCAKTFSTKNGLRVHIQQMHKYQPKSACTICGARVRYLQSHMRKHSAAPEAAYCTECDQKFTSTASYKSHLKYSARHRAPDTVLRYACQVCDVKFVNSTGLKKHTLRRHSTVRPFKCDRCGKGFEAQWRLKQHILHFHEGVEKPKVNICHICGRGFSTKFMLSNHIRVHTGEKPFRCDICSAAFSQKSSLTTHMRGVHLRLKPRPGRPHRA